MARFNKIVGDKSTYELGGDALLTTRRSGTVAVDIETAGLGDKQWDVKAIVVASTDHAHILDPETDIELVRDCLDAADEIVMHNSTFDCPPLVDIGAMRPRHVGKVFDTVVAARMARPGHESKSLGNAAERHLGEGYAVAKRSLSDAYRALTSRSKSQMFADLGLDSDAYVSYAGFDGVMTARLRQALPEAIVEWTHDHPFKRTDIDVARLIDREQTVNRILLAETVRGIEVDKAVVDRLRGEMGGVVNAADGVLEQYGIDAGLSRTKIKERAVDVLDELGKIPKGHKRLASGRPSASKDLIERIDHPIAEALVRRSQALRFMEDYGDKLDTLSHHGRIHPTVSVMTAVTGRMSMGNPPLQQYPAGVRQMMRWDQSVTSMDWSSIEPVFAGNVFGQLDWIEGFEAGGDLYQPIADQAGVSRKVAKVILLAQLYGQGFNSLSEKLGVSPDEARELIARVMGPLSNVKAASESIRGISEKFGKVQTVSGRIVPQPPDYATGNNRFKGYIGVNHLVQGSCLDLLSEVIYSAAHAGLGDHIHIALHDELVVDTAVADEIERLMLTPPEDFVMVSGRVPKLRVGRAELGTNWLDKEAD